jgi:hypothetical protein
MAELNFLLRLTPNVSPMPQSFVREPSATLLVEQMIEPTLFTQGESIILII